jgi:hypothetical protein
VIYKGKYKKGEGAAAEKAHLRENVVEFLFGL